MGVFEGCSRVILVVVNILFALIGITLVIVGCIVRFGGDVLDSYLDDLYSSFTSLMKKAGTNVDLSNFNLGDYLGNATLAIILIGTFFLLIGIFGCCGACCKVKPLLVMYAVILILIVLAEVIFVILLFTIRDKIEGALKEPMLDTIHNDYAGFNGTDVISLGWNFAMISFKCCGVDNYTDFEEAKKWNRNFTDPTKKTSEFLTVPIACCKLNGTFPNVDPPSDFTCAVKPTNSNSNIDKPCYQAIEDFIIDNSDILIGVGVGVLVFELLMIAFAFCVCCSAKKKKDEYDDYY